MRSAQRHKGGARRAEDSRGAECAVGLIPHQAAGILTALISRTIANVRKGPKAVTDLQLPQRLSGAKPATSSLLVRHHQKLGAGGLFAIDRDSVEPQGLGK